MSLTAQQITHFQQIVKDYYSHVGRHDLAWRQPDKSRVFDPYNILVSEIMLQQTQVSRVEPKYREFLKLYPSVDELADSSLSAVLTTWSGLGYNRRAKFLHQAAKSIVQEFEGKFPDRIDQLTRLPGVGRNTAGAIMAYAFNKPVLFVETNIRTVYFYHFFRSREGVSDGEVADLLAQTLDHTNPREWYWALMDYGAYLKSSGMKLNVLSKHYTKQSKFVGSKRQIRGQIIRNLATQDQSLDQIHSIISDNRLMDVIADLLREGLITQKNNRYHLSD